MIASLLISSSLNQLKEQISKTLALQLANIKINHPDVLYFQQGEKLGIAEAKKIREHFLLKPYSAKGRAVVVEDITVMTAEAQNALLKTLEELPKDAVLILGAQSDANLLPTVLSRCQITYLKNPRYQAMSTSEVGYVGDLQTASIEERFEFVEKLKDKEKFLQDLVSYFRQQMIKSCSSKPTLEFTSQLLQAEQWAKQNGNLRAILEYLMLVLPSKM